MKHPTFENYPRWMVLISNSVGLAIYAIGFSVISRIGIVWGLLYLAYCVWVETRVLSRSCRSCYYYGKRCAFGKGRISAWLFEPGEEHAMSTKRVTWHDIVPDFLVSLIPLGVGIILLIRAFSWQLLLLVLVLAFLASVGSGFVRGQLACKYCKQRELGCPAEQLFSKTKPAEEI